MAKERIALGINLRQNKITGNAGYGKYYPEVDVQKTLSLRGFAIMAASMDVTFSRVCSSRSLNVFLNWYRRAFLCNWVVWVPSTPLRR